MYKKIMIISLFSLIYTMDFAKADDAIDFSRELEQQIAQTQTAIMDGKTPSSTAKSDDEYFFRRFWFRLRGKVGIKLPGIYNLQVIPEAEMLFERALPDGYTSYKP